MREKSRARFACDLHFLLAWRGVDPCLVGTPDGPGYARTGYRAGRRGQGCAERYDSFSPLRANERVVAFENPSKDAVLKSVKVTLVGGRRGQERLLAEPKKVLEKLGPGEEVRLEFTKPKTKKTGAGAASLQGATQD